LGTLRIVAELFIELPEYKAIFFNEAQYISYEQAIPIHDPLGKEI
jgi:hypothetical protein